MISGWPVARPKASIGAAAAARSSAAVFVWTRPKPVHSALAPSLPARTGPRRPAPPSAQVDGRRHPRIGRCELPLAYPGFGREALCVRRARRAREARHSSFPTSVLSSIPVNVTVSSIGLLLAGACRYSRQALPATASTPPSSTAAAVQAIVAALLFAMASARSVATGRIASRALRLSPVDHEWLLADTYRPDERKAPCSRPTRGPATGGRVSSAGSLGLQPCLRGTPQAVARYPLGIIRMSHGREASGRHRQRYRGHIVATLVRPGGCAHLRGDRPQRPARRGPRRAATKPMRIFCPW